MPKIKFSKPQRRGEEEWKALPICEVMISSLGRVWDGNLVAQSDSPGGYLMVRLPSVNGGKPIGVHRLVAHAFHGECPDGQCVDHIDGDQSNNRPENLQYVTAAENTRLYWQRRKAMGPIDWDIAQHARKMARLIVRRRLPDDDSNDPFLAQERQKLIEREILIQRAQAELASGKTGRS